MFHSRRYPQAGFLPVSRASGGVCDRFCSHGPFRGFFMIFTFYLEERC
ncbi:hypothetical protein [Zobellella denitrificans]|jgi:hypothetical protein|nr:hypothetical protein [Zobellella denitrificans]